MRNVEKRKKLGGELNSEVGMGNSEVGMGNSEKRKKLGKHKRLETGRSESLSAMIIFAL